ncbi:MULTISPECIES: DUF1259 domain-containing protein [Clostridium]|uniref:DUF1259 domain-containing protein n=1 Tax=Clostridium TaxID=1485 RepID=UPI00069F300D|nr:MULTISPECIES: DUF1259 domain-containing protein [Clostridium]KOF56416.1 hypothetical protein AGR56_06335 [Clostridium sp. DMHC 10]MCD2345833.1 DUF1259 domain-containing protein [Clostridium guangxiense]
MYISNNCGYCPYMKNFVREDTEASEEEDSTVETNADPNSTLCEQFASILKGKVTESKPGSCAVEKDRGNLNVTISGIPVKTVLKGEFSFQGMNAVGRALNLGEIVVLQDELNRFLTALKRNGIDISGVHNHWIYDNPRILYVHFQSVENPLNFARKVAEALRVLK